MSDEDSLRVRLARRAEYTARFLLFLAIVLLTIVPLLIGVAAGFFWGIQHVESPYLAPYVGLLVLSVIAIFYVGQKVLNWCAVLILDIPPVKLGRN